MILVSGLVNIETTVKVKGFPIEYFPIDYPFFGIKSSVSGVGRNVSKGLLALGETVRLVSLIGQDAGGSRIQQTLQEDGLALSDLKAQLKETPESLILYDPSGRRAIYSDLKDVQDQVYEGAEQALEGCQLAVLCNINFSRGFINLAKQKGIPIATDVHVLSDLEDAYNQDFLEAADLLFLSDEKLPCAPEDFIGQIKDKFPAKLIVLGQGSKGAMMYVREEDKLYHLEAVTTRPVINTVGAGDALFSGFVHYYIKGLTPLEALKRAQIFASYKIGESGGAQGFPNETQVTAYYEQLKLI